jgi:ElaB/YqjD/DUF883 family membrane-anchored ribosome-binding protein
MAPARATTPRRTSTSAANGAARRTRSTRVKSDDLEAQVSQLQSDLRSITQTLTRMGESRVDEVRGAAKARAQSLMDKGQSAFEEAQDEFGALEKQIKDTIREKPLTAVAGAVALGFILAVITR